MRYNLQFGLRSMMVVLGVLLLIDGLQIPYALGCLLADEIRMGELTGIRFHPEAETFTLEIVRKSPRIGPCLLTYVWGTLWQIIAGIFLGGMLIYGGMLWSNPFARRYLVQQ